MTSSRSLKDLIGAMRLNRVPFTCGKTDFFDMISVRVDREGTWDHELSCKKNDKILDFTEGIEQYLIVDTGIFIYDRNVEQSIKKDRDGQETLVFKAIDKGKPANVKYYDNDGNFILIDNDMGEKSSYSFNARRCYAFEFEMYEFHKNKYFVSRKISHTSVYENFVIHNEPKQWAWTF